MFGFTINYADPIIMWVDHGVSLKDPHKFFDPEILNDLNDQLCYNKEDNFFDCKILENYSTWISDDKFEHIDINKVATDQKQLTSNQHHDLQNILAKYEKLFDGSLGVYPHKKFTSIFSLAWNLYTKGHTLYLAFIEIFKKELKHMVNIGILEEWGASEWALLCFIIPKKDGNVWSIVP